MIESGNIDTVELTEKDLSASVRVEYLSGEYCVMVNRECIVSFQTMAEANDFIEISGLAADETNTVRGSAAA